MHHHQFAATTYCGRILPSHTHNVCVMVVCVRSTSSMIEQVGQSCTAQTAVISASLVSRQPQACAEQKPVRTAQQPKDKTLRAQNTSGLSDYRNQPAVSAALLQQLIQAPLNPKQK